MADVVDRRRHDRLEHLHLLVAHPLGLERGRGLHREQRQELQHVVLDEIAKRSGPFVVAGAALDADFLRRGDLDVVDEVAVPDGLEQRICESQRHQVLDRLLSQVVVDAKDLRLLEYVQHTLVQLARRREIEAERLLDHDPRLRSFAAVQPRGAELGADQREELRRRRQVEDTVQRVAGLIVEIAQEAIDLGVDAVVIEHARHVAHLGEQPVEHVRVWPSPREALDRLARHLLKVLVRLLAAGDADQLEPLRECSLVREVVQSGQQLAAGEVARRAEDDERGRMDRKVLEPLDQRVLDRGLLFDDRGHRSTRLAAAR